MTVKRKKKSTLMGGRAVTVAFSLCLLAVVAMIGMYTVGKSEQKEKELKQEIVKAARRLLKRIRLLMERSWKAIFSPNRQRLRRIL